VDARANNSYCPDVGTHLQNQLPVVEREAEAKRQKGQKGKNSAFLSFLPFCFRFTIYCEPGF
jgi:hypothetical protein